MKLSIKLNLIKRYNLNYKSSIIVILLFSAALIINSFSGGIINNIILDLLWSYRGGAKIFNVYEYGSELQFLLAGISGLILTIIPILIIYSLFKKDFYKQIIYVSIISIVISLFLVSCMIFYIMFLHYISSY